MSRMPPMGDDQGGAPPPMGPPGGGGPPGAGPGGPPPDAGAGGAPPDQGGGPQSQIEGLIARMITIINNLKNVSPLMSSGLTKAADGLQEAHTSLRMGRNVQPAPQQNPPV